MKNKDRSSSCCNNRRRQSSKCFCNFCKCFSHNIETCYHRNKSAASISTATITNTESVQPMAPISAQSKSSGRTFTMSTDNLKNIIANIIHMVSNASYSYSLSALSGKSSLILCAFSDADWAEDPTVCRSTTGYCFLLGSSLILSEVRNKFMWPAPVLKQNIVPLLIPHLSSFGYNGFSKT